MKRVVRIIVSVLGVAAAVVCGAVLLNAVLLQLMLGIFSIASDSNGPMPPDDEMCEHFLQHEVAYEAVYEIVVEHFPYGYHYPPHEASDTVCLRGVDPGWCPVLDSLLNEIGCRRIYYAGRAARREQCERWGWQRDTTDISITFSYWCRGLSIGGTGKDIVCNPKFSGCGVVTDGRELNDICRDLMRDTTIYKPIKGKWYIELSYDR